MKVNKDNISSINSGFFNYYFVGDILGNIYIYSVSKKNKNKNDEEDEEKFEICDSFEVNNDETKHDITETMNGLNIKNFIYYNKKKKGNILPVLKNGKSIFDFELKIINKLYDH